MDQALCILDQEIKHVNDFEILPEEELIIKRRALLCPECRESAFFRKRTKTGGVACFGAKHKKGCSLASNQPQANETYCDRGSAIVIDFNFGANRPSLGDDRQEDFSGIDLNTFQNETNEQKISRRMSRLLKSLLYNEGFNGSDREIKFNGQSRIVSEFFKTPQEALNHRGEKKKYGVWGIISDAHYLKETLWLNFGGTVNDLSIPFGKEVAYEFGKRYGINEVEELSGVEILVIGWINQAKESEKVFIRFEELKYLSIRKNI